MLVVYNEPVKEEPCKTGITDSYHSGNDGKGDLPPEIPPKKAKAKKLVTSVTRRVVKRTTLELRFTLTAKARVQLVAKRKKTIVAKTKRTTMKKGRHVLRLKLNAKRWPTALDLRAVAA